MRKLFNILCFKLVIITLLCLCTLICCGSASALATSLTHVLAESENHYFALILTGENVSVNGTTITMKLGDTLQFDYRFSNKHKEWDVWVSGDNNDWYDLNDPQLNANNAVEMNIPSGEKNPYLRFEVNGKTYVANAQGKCTLFLQSYSGAIYDGNNFDDFELHDFCFDVIITDEKSESTPFVEVDAGNENGLLAYATGGQGMNINVTSNTDWQLKVTEGADWITLSRSSGSGNDSFYTTINPNNGSERTGWIELTAPGCETIRIRVTQEGIPLTSAPEWQSESKEIDSLEDAVQLFYQVEDSAKYVLLTYEGYDASEQLIEQYTLGTYKVKKQAMAAVSSHKYEIDTLEGFDKPISKLYLTICDENSNLLSQRSEPFVIYRTDLIDGTAVAGGSLLAPEWASESKNVNSEEDSIGLYYQVDESAQYVKLEYEGYDENDQLIEIADEPLGVYPVEKHVMAMVSDHKYKIGNSFSQFSVPASKLYLTVCDAYGNALSPRSEAMVVYRQDLIEAATKPEIFSVVLSCNGADAIVGERFTLTVETNSKTTKLVAKNNTGTGFKEPDAWSAKQNSDGTITWTRSYTAEDEAKGRYWTVTPYNAVGTKAAAVSSNKIDIDGLEWYTAYYKFDNKGKKVPAADGIIEVDASQVQNIQIYAGDLHPSDNNGQNPYYYKIEDTSVLSVANEHSFNMKVGNAGDTTVEIWNENSDCKVTSVLVKVNATNSNPVTPFNVVDVAEASVSSNAITIMPTPTVTTSPDAASYEIFYSVIKDGISGPLIKAEGNYINLSILNESTYYLTIGVQSTENGKVQFRQPGTESASGYKYVTNSSIIKFNDAQTTLSKTGTATVDFVDPNGNVLTSFIINIVLAAEVVNDYSVEVIWLNAPEGSRTANISNNGYFNVYSGNVVDNLDIRVSKNNETAYPQIVKQSRPKKGDLYWEVDDPEYQNGYSRFDGLSLSLRGPDRTIAFYLYEYTDELSAKVIHKFLIHLSRTQALAERYTLCITGIKHGYIPETNARSPEYSNHDVSIHNSVKVTGIGLQTLEWFTEYPEVQFGVLDTVTNKVYLNNSLGFNIYIAENSESYVLGQYIKLKEKGGTHTVYLKKDDIPIDKMSIYADVYFYRNEVEWGRLIDVVANGGLTLMGQYLAKSMLVFDVVTNTYMYGFDPGRTAEALIEYVEYTDASSEAYWQEYVLEDFLLMEEEDAEVVYTLTSEFLSLLEMCDIGATFSTDGKINVEVEYSVDGYSGMVDVALNTITLVDAAYDTGIREVEYFLVGKTLYEFGYHESGKRIMKRVEENITIEQGTLIYVVDEDELNRLQYDVTNLYSEDEKDEMECILYIDKESQTEGRNAGINKPYFNFRGVEETEDNTIYNVIQIRDLI